MPAAFKHDIMIFGVIATAIIVFGFLSAFIPYIVFTLALLAGALVVGYFARRGLQEWRSVQEINKLCEPRKSRKERQQ